MESPASSAVKESSSSFFSSPFSRLAAGSCRRSNVCSLGKGLPALSQDFPRLAEPNTGARAAFRLD